MFLCSGGWTSLNGLEARTPFPTGRSPTPVWLSIRRRSLGHHFTGQLTVVRTHRTDPVCPASGICVVQVVSQFDLGRIGREKRSTSGSSLMNESEPGLGGYPQRSRVPSLDAEDHRFILAFASEASKKEKARSRCVASTAIRTKDVIAHVHFPVLEPAFVTVVVSPPTRRPCHRRRCTPWVEDRLFLSRSSVVMLHPDPRPARRCRRALGVES